MARLSRSERVAVKRAEEAQKGLPSQHDDDKPHHYPWNDDTKRKQREAIEMWTDWVRDDSIDEKYLPGPDFCVPPTELFKKFARYVTQASNGLIEEIPQYRNVCGIMSRLFGGLLNVTGTRLDHALRQDIHAFVKHQLVKEGRITTKTKAKYMFMEKDMINVEFTLWMTPDASPRTEWTRVTITFGLHMFTFTGCRIGAIFPDDADKARDIKGLRYKDIELTLLPRHGRRPELVLCLSQKWIKSNSDPNDRGITTGMTWRQDILHDSIPWFLAMAFTCNAFKHFNTVSELMEQEVPPQMSIFPIKWKDEVKDCPVFRQTPSSHEPMTQTQWRAAWEPLLKQAGYCMPVTIHRIRQGVSNALDGHVTPSQRKQVLGQSQPVFDQAYISSLSSIDVQALFLGEAPRRDHIEQLQSVSRYRIKGFPVALPTRERASALSNPDLAELENQRHGLSKSDTNDMEQLEKDIKATKARLLTQALKRYQKEWVDIEYEKSIKSRGKSDDKPEPQQRRFQRLLAFMPERKRMCAVFDRLFVYSEEQRISIIEDLITLAGKSSEELYRPGEAPIDGRCPVPSCADQSSGDSSSMQRHIHACRQKEFLECLPRGAKAQYCYECFKWFKAESEWDHHCENHLHTLNKGCGPIFLSGTRSLLVSPGLCPFCLGRQTDPSRRWLQWTDQANLLRHIDKHLTDDLKEWPFACPHPLCTQQLESMEELSDHFETVHEFQKFSPFKLKQRSPPQRIQRKRGYSTEVDAPAAKRRHGKMHLSKLESSNQWRKYPEEGFIHWRPSATLTAPPTLAAGDNIKADSPSRASSPDWETVWNQFDAEQALRETPDYSSESTLSGGTVSPLSLTSTSISSEFSTSLSNTGHNDSIWETPAASSTFCWSTLEELPEMSLLLGPEQAIDPSHSVSTFSELLDMSSDTPSHEPPGSPESLLSFSELLAHHATPELPEHNGSPTTHSQTVIDLTSPPLSPSDDFPCAIEETKVNNPYHTRKPKPPRRLPISPDSCPECRTQLPGPLPLKLLVRERIERCEVCARQKMERAQTQWAQRGYPEISWSDLPDRVERHIPWLIECLEKKDVPLFRKEYVKIRRRIDFQVFLVENPRSGYYGPRGEDIICSHLMNRIATVLRNMASHDPVVRKSPVDYVMQVLVPAAVVRLIMEDMTQDEPTALETLKEGTSLGKVLHGEESESK